LADPCKAVPNNGPTPAYLAPGRTFSGRVVYVADGSNLCVAVRRGRRHWVEVRIADFYAPQIQETGGDQAKAALAHFAMGQSATCVAGRRSYDRVVARCTIGGRSIGDMMRAAGVREAGLGDSRR
jgi:endonuclease YncB( thermonuclease family)